MFSRPHIYVRRLEVDLHEEDVGPEAQKAQEEVSLQRAFFYYFFLFF
jgi:hypothetical protein